MIIEVNSIIIASISSKEKFIFDKFKITVPENITSEQFGEWISGFIDGEGYLGFYIDKNNSAASQPKFTFKIETHIDDINILYLIQNYFKAGSVYTSKTRAAAIYIISGYKNCYNNVVPLLDKYPLKTNKYYDFINFRDIITIRLTISSNRLEGDILDKAIITKNKINYRNFRNSPTGITISKYWLLGFIEGEGTFVIKNLVPYFQVGQHKKSEYLLDIITQYLYKSVDSRYKFKISKTLNKRTSVLIISVTSIEVLFEMNKSLFITIPFQSRKKIDFLYWSIVLYIHKYGYFFIKEGRKFVIETSVYFNTYRYTNAKIVATVPNFEALESVLSKPFSVIIDENLNHTEMAKLFSKSQGKPKIWIYDNDKLIEGSPFTGYGQALKIINKPTNSNIVLTRPTAELVILILVKNIIIVIVFILLKNIISRIIYLRQDFITFTSIPT